jgi:hypothetical protein
MIGQYLPNNNETATVAFRQKFCQLNSLLVFHHIIRINFSLKRFFKKLYPSQTQDHFKTGAPKKKQVRVPSIIFVTEEEPTRQPAIQFELPTL